MSEIVVTTVAERPELLERLYDFQDSWPEFMKYDPIGNSLLGQVPGTFPAYCVVATIDGAVIARGLSLPFRFPTERRTELPDDGWDAAMMWGMADHRRGDEPTVASALEIAIDAEHLGKGLSYTMLDALRVAVRRQGLSTLYAPVRPNGKTDPRQPMTLYVEERRADGLPADPWLRVHVRAGGTIVRVAPTSMVMPGSIAQWRERTGLPFDTDGEAIVPGALTPVHVDLAHDHAVYVEPNVWVRHNLS